MPLQLRQRIFDRNTLEKMIERKICSLLNYRTQKDQHELRPEPHSTFEVWHLLKELCEGVVALIASSQISFQ